MTMQDLFDYFKSLGIHVNESSNPFLLLLFSILILSCIALLCVLNISLYAGILYMFEDKDRIDRLSKVLPSFIMKLINIYKQTRIYYLIIEVLLLLYCLISIIWYSGKVVLGLLSV